MEVRTSRDPSEPQRSSGQAAARPAEHLVGQHLGGRNHPPQPQGSCSAWLATEKAPSCCLGEPPAPLQLPPQDLPFGKCQGRRLWVT